MFHSPSALKTILSAFPLLPQLKAHTVDNLKQIIKFLMKSFGTTQYVGNKTPHVLWHLRQHTTKEAITNNIR